MKQPNEQERKILMTCDAMFPRLTEHEKDKVLSFVEGMSFMAQQRQASPRPESRT